MSASTNFPGYNPNTIYEQQQGKARVPNLFSMRYKNYIWPHNPSIYNIRFTKRIVQHNYMWINSAEIEDMGMEARVMSGSGAFFGEDAYLNFGKLASVFYDKGPGILVHPIWQDANVVFTKLEVKNEPLPNYVEYEFEFTEHIDINIIKEIDVKVNNTDNKQVVANILSDKVTHTVKQGETLSYIGSLYGVPWRQIADDNKYLIKDPNLIQIGWQLTINKPAKKPNVSSSNGTGDKAYDRFMRDFGDQYGG